ncbi:hypothetical protein D3C80_1796650 [compost metagenome]
MYFILLLRFGCEHNDSNTRITRTQLLAYLEAAYRREHDIQQRDVERTLRLRKHKRILPVLRLHNLHIITLQVNADEAADGLLILQQ